MQVYHDEAEQQRLQSMRRAHPWTTTVNTEGGRYVDFKGHPELISATLEDLQPFAGTAIEATTVDFIAWANSDASKLETNDFALSIGLNTSQQSTAKLQLFGRFSLLFRDLADNLDPSIFGPFVYGAEQQLRLSDPNFAAAVWGWCVWPHRFIDLDRPEEPANGACLLYRVWGWGDTQADVGEAYGRAVRNLHAALVAAVNFI